MGSMLLQESRATLSRVYCCTRQARGSLAKPLQSAETNHSRTRNETITCVRMFKFAMAKYFVGTRGESGLSGQQYFVFSHRLSGSLMWEFQNLAFLKRNWMKASRNVSVVQNTFKMRVTLRFFGITVDGRLYSLCLFMLWATSGVHIVFNDSRRQ